MSAPAHALTFAIGDIHGCFDKLTALLRACDVYRDGRPARFVCLGDYVDRGPQTRAVLVLLMAGEVGGCELICLRGNHEEMLLGAADRDRSDRALMTWFGNGGEATLASYGIDDPGDIPAAHLAWLASLPLLARDDHRLFVHAGVRPGVARDAQTAEDLMWIREPFLSSEVDHGALVVHGHTPLRGRAPDLRANRLNLDTAAAFGGVLTAAAFADRQRAPLAFITDAGAVVMPEVAAPLSPSRRP